MNQSMNEQINESMKGWLNQREKRNVGKKRKKNYSTLFPKVKLGYFDIMASIDILLIMFSLCFL